MIHMNPPGTICKTKRADLNICFLSYTCLAHTNDAISKFRLDTEEAYLLCQTFVVLVCYMFIFTSVVF